MNIESNVSLCDKNWFKTGGAARYFCQPTTEIEMQEALAFARAQNSDVFMLGEGANILISDDGFNGLVINPELRTIRHDAAGHVTAGAGVRLPDLINYCLDNGLSGLEEFSGIPGTVGGALYINVHYFQFFLGDFLVAARVIDAKTGVISDVDASWFGFGYNQSKLLAKQQYVVQATFALKTVDALQVAYAKGRRDEIIRHRNQRYPRTNTCGSFFRNFLPEELLFEIEGKKVPFVAYYLDKVGIKGALSVGKAVVSYQHANMIVSNQGATSQDIVLLAKAMQQRVHDAFGIVPKPECQLIGFKENPLL